MLVIFTDLDGTLLEEDGSLSEDACATLGALRTRGIRIVPLTSKTRLELAHWLEVLDSAGAGAFENGAGILTSGIPRAGDRKILRKEEREAEILPAAVPLPELRLALDALRRQTGLPLLSFEEIPDSEWTRTTGLPLEKAAAARAREFDLPFIVSDGAAAAISSTTLPPRVRLVRGGRFWHLSGLHDKADAARRLLELLRPSRTIGLGDAPNDVSFLRIVDHPVLVPTKGGVDGALRAALPDADVAPAPSGAGWSAAVRALVAAERVGG
ncbi:MAG TPA: HAD-IIB family hydrolase [Thermoanaerobaculia bacterium]|nr:HAD-IIB family hydrolase [Thermoanaerobaculia bacterium]